MNILITCAGRRNYLINYFKEALGRKGKVFAGDSNPYAPALQEADQALILPPVNHSNYVDILSEVCRKYDIRLMLSLNDLELPILAQNRSIFLQTNTIPVISSPDVVNKCFDKWQTISFLASCGISVPKSFLTLNDALGAINKNEIRFPLVVKPRWGTASIGIEFSNDLTELELTFKLVQKRLYCTILSDVSALDPERNVLIQEQLIGHEYHVDIVNDSVTDGDTACP